MNLLDRYKTNLHESISDFIGAFFYKKVLSKLKDAEKIAEQDPEMLSALNNIKTNYDKANSSIENFIKKYPNSELAKDLRKKGK